MGSKDKATCWMVGVAALFLTVLILGCYGLSIYESVKMAALGYQKTTLVGSRDSEYQKAK